VHLTNHVAEFGTSLEKIIDLFDLRQDGAGLPADGFAIRRAGARARARIFIGGGPEYRANRRGKDAGRPLLQKLPRLSVALASAALVRVEQAYRNINHSDVERRKAVEQVGQCADFPNPP
jgi:hypothetical protein